MELREVQTGMAAEALRTCISHVARTWPCAPSYDSWSALGAASRITGTRMADLTHVKSVRMRAATLAGAAAVLPARPLNQVLNFRKVLLGGRGSVRAVLEAGMSVQAEDSVGRTMLEHASDAGKLELVQLLLDKGADPSSNMDSLKVAARQGDLGVVDILLNNIGEQLPRSWRYDIEKSIQVACAFGRVEAADRLIQFALMIQAERGGHISSIAEAMRSGAIESLQGAASAGHVDVVLLLLRRGAKVDDRGKNGCMALHCAASAGRPQTIRALVQVGNANMEVRTAGRITNVTAQRLEGHTPLMLAVKEGQQSAVVTLLQLGADLNRSLDDRGRSPLDLAVLMEREAIVQLFLEQGASVTCRCLNWWAPRCKSDKIRELLAAELMRRGEKIACNMLIAKRQVFQLEGDDGLKSSEANSSNDQLWIQEKSSRSAVAAAPSPGKLIRTSSSTAETFAAGPAALASQRFSGNSTLEQGRGENLREALRRAGSGTSQRLGGISMSEQGREEHPRETLRRARLARFEAY